MDFSQFCKLAARFIEVEEDVGALQNELKEAFRVYDKEGKGYLTVATLRSILHELDDKISNQDLDSIIEEIDADGSGTVDFDGMTLYSIFIWKQKKLKTGYFINLFQNLCKWWQVIYIYPENGLVC